MTKKTADDFFVSLIPMLTTIIKGVSYKNHKAHINTDTVISEAYLHMIKNMKDIPDKPFLQRLVINFINRNIQWHNSKINKLERVNNNLHFYSNSGDENNDTSLHKTVRETIEREDTQDVDLLHKINIEEWYNEKQCILHMYRAQEEDKVKQIIFDLYFIKGIKKGVHLAKHLSINKDYGCQYIRELKSDVQAYAINYDIKNNNKKK